MQLEVVWSPLLQAGSEGPALISCAVMHTPYNIQKCARGALAVIETLKLRVEMMTGIGTLATGFSRGESRSPGMTRQSTLNPRMKLHDLHCYNKAISVLLGA